MKMKKYIIIISLFVIIFVIYKLRFKIVFQPSSKFINDTPPLFYIDNNITGCLFENNKNTLFLFSHGTGGNISYYVPIIDKLKNIGDVLIYDYPGYGRSKGFPTEKNILESGEIALNYALSLNYKKVVLYGFSLGGAVTVHISAISQSSNIKGVILQSTFAKLEDCVPLIGRLVVGGMFRSLDILPKVRYPICFLHSPGDGVVPFISSKKLYDVTNSPKMFINLREYPIDGDRLMRHNDVIPSDMPIQSAIDFFNSHV